MCDNIIKHLARYEAEAERVMTSNDCRFSFPLERREVTNVDSNHQPAFIRQQGSWQTTKSPEPRQVEDEPRESEERFAQTIENAPYGYYRVGENGVWQYVNPMWEHMYGFSLQEAICGSLEMTQPKEVVRQARENIRRALSGDTVTGKSSRVTKDGSIGYHTFKIQPVYEGGEIVAAEGFVTDTTEQRRVEERLARAKDKLAIQVKERVAELKKANNELSKEITARKQAEEVSRKSELKYRYLLDNMPDSLAYCKILVNENNQPIDFVCLEVNNTFETLTGFKREDILNRKLLEVIPDLKESKTALLSVYNRAALDRDGGKFDLYCKTLGKRFTISAYRPQKGYFAIIFRDVTESKRTVSELSGLSRLLFQAHEEERRFVARELHDQTGQVLTYLSLLLDRAARLPADSIAAELDEAKKLVTELIGQVRDLSLSLRPSILDDMGLLPTLLWHFEHYTSKTGVEVNFKSGRLPKNLPPEVSTAAYRIMQEALTNVARHAGVSRVEVSIWANRGVLHLKIKDRGIGFVVKRTGDYSGLNGMQERAHLLGGTMVIDSTPRVGTTVKAELPLPDIPKRKKK